MCINLRASTHLSLLVLILSQRQQDNFFPNDCFEEKLDFCLEKVEKLVQYVNFAHSNFGAYSFVRIIWINFGAFSAFCALKHALVTDFF